MGALPKVIGSWDVVETVEVTERLIAGELLPVTITRRVGLCQYEGPDGKPILADEATFLDYGSKLGMTKIYDRHPETPPTEAEREAGREHIRQVAIQAITEQGLWGKIGRPA